MWASPGFLPVGPLQRRARGGPQMGGQNDTEDRTTGRISVGVLRANDDAGRFGLICDQFCGALHESVFL